MVSNIYIYDISFLVLFTLFVIIFLYKKRKNLKRDGPMYLYPTKVGIDFIDYVGTKYKRTISVLSFIGIITGYAMMIIMLYSIGQFVYVYLFKPEIVRLIKVPPIMPLVPYVPELFQIKFLKPFYFTYWIIAIAVIAIFHEFAHGVVAKRYKVKIKSTGFGFLGPFLAAFVEPDEKQMQKKKKIQQISILSAGTFTNLVLSIIFFLILLLFFLMTYAPSGAMFNMYSPEIVNITDIQMIGKLPIKSLESKELLKVIEGNNLSNDYVNGEERHLNLTKVIVNTKSYLIDINILKEQLKDGKIEAVYLYKDLPAVKAGMQGTIIEINGEKVITYPGLGNIMKKYKPGDKIIIKTKMNDKINEYEITLAEDSTKPGAGVIGIVYLDSKRSGVLGKIFNFFNFYQKPGTEYEPKFNEDLIIFLYNLFWWLALINLSVALVNMLPMAMFDGGRMFMLTVWGITGSKRVGELAFKFITYFILGALVVVMFGWAIAIF